MFALDKKKTGHEPQSPVTFLQLLSNPSTTTLQSFNDFAQATSSTPPSTNQAQGPSRLQLIFRLLQALTDSLFPTRPPGFNWISPLFDPGPVRLNPTDPNKRPG